MGHGINIKNREFEALLHEISAATGKGTTRIVLDLARDEAERLRRVRDGHFQAELARLEAISKRAAAKIMPDAPHPDTIIGYDDRGLPT